MSQHRFQLGRDLGAVAFAVCCGLQGCLPPCTDPTSLHVGRRRLLQSSLPPSRSLGSEVDHYYTGSSRISCGGTCTRWTLVVTGCTYGSSYRKMMGEVKTVMDSSDTLFPALKGKRPQLAGFVWFQGWNDQYGAENEYASNMKHFI